MKIEYKRKQCDRPTISVIILNVIILKIPIKKTICQTNFKLIIGYIYETHFKYKDAVKDWDT